MTCAACDDCPRDAWHLHITVQPHWSWNVKDVASALQREIERFGAKPVVITNVFRDERRNYKELIPTKHVRGTEAEASREIFQMGVLLNNAGWRVRRLKIEGDPAHIKEGRALYYESHLKNPALGVRASLGLRAPTSTNAKGDHIVTVRRPTYESVVETMVGWRDAGLVDADTVRDARIEAAVLDTNPALDADWINE